LALWTGEQLKSLETLPLIVLLLIIIASVNFITEITSNIATTALMLPVLASLANAIDVHPFFLLVGATVAASCAFMLPVATPPNAIVFGSGHLKIEDMVKKGLWMNVISIIILTLMVYFILPIFWEFPALN
jgi:sodium-dependent dicarboxylate transporter 2/3/5